ncbi:MAG: PIN domain-containing protein [Acetobacteraceae bacterium]|nr:PIN domain-containing protein [Acetobacteraceae bacterium]
MTLLPDTSALASAFLHDVHAERARAALASVASIAVSSFAAAEFASAVSLRVRTRHLSRDAALRVLDVFDTWVSLSADKVEVLPADIDVAAGYVRRFDLALKAPDALHLAVASRLGLPLLTFDARQAAAARALGVACDPAGAAPAG